MKLRSLFAAFLAAAALVSPAFADAIIVEQTKASTAPIWLLLAAVVIVVALVLIALQLRKKRR